MFVARKEPCVQCKEDKEGDGAAAYPLRGAGGQEARGISSDTTMEKAGRGPSSAENGNKSKTESRHACRHACSVFINTHTHTHTKKMPSQGFLPALPWLSSHINTRTSTQNTHTNTNKQHAKTLSLSLSPRLSTFLSTSLPTLSRIMPVTKHDNELDGPSTRIIADGTEVQHARLNVHVARPRACAG